MSGGEIIWAWCLSHRVSHSLDTEISASYPEFWSAWLEKVYWKEQVVWSPGYFVSTVGLDEKQITEYVKWQAHQDSGQAKLEL